MDADHALRKVFKLHKYENIFNNSKYSIDKCTYCDKHQVTHKDFAIKSKYNLNELPENIKNLIG